MDPGLHHSDTTIAMRWSLAVGALMLIGKTSAWYITGSSAILSDALESVVHVAAVAFAAFSLWLSARPANHQYLFGYERISYFSAGFEGSMIILAALSIIVTAIQKWLAGLELERLGLGTLLVAAAGLLNAGLGIYLVRTGRRTHSLILEANGRHVLTDSWTSTGVAGGLLIVMITGWKPFDPLIAMAVALHILWSGAQLLWRAARGLMDFSDPAEAALIGEKLQRICADLGVEYHGVRFRDSGQRLLIEFHLLFPYHTKVGEAHSVATQVEERLTQALERRAEIVTHLESLEDHDQAHLREHYTGKPMPPYSR
jgi:cation diffusion facilitator family transporter